MTGGAGDTLATSTAPAETRSLLLWRLVVSSTLFCTLAYNLTFFEQELSLVIAKALTPGLHPVLFHNNHNWTGHSPLVNLLQGTGLLADLASGLLFSIVLACAPSAKGRLFFFWMAFEGAYEGLPQIVIGSIMPANDVGHAMSYLEFAPAQKWAASLFAVLVMAGWGYWLGNQCVRLLATAAESATAAARRALVFWIVVCPALTSVLLVVPFREPRNVVEVVLVPLIAAVLGALFVPAGAWRAPPSSRPAREAASIVAPLVLLAIVLALFQVVLRPGIAFG